MIVLKDIRKSHLEALLDYMYVGEVDVKQSELAGLIKAAECLRIKGLAVPDEDPSASGSSKNQKKVSNNSSSSNSDNVSDSVNRRTGGATGSGGSPTPPRKRQRKDSGDKGSSDINVMENSSSFSTRGGNEPSTSVPSQQSPSLKRRISPERDDDEPEILPIDQIKVEREDQSGGPSNVDDDSGRGIRSLATLGSEGDGMVGGSNTGHEDDHGDYFQFTKDDIEKQEHDQDIEQMDSYTDSMEAGPSGMQEVGLIYLFLNPDK